MASLRIQPSLLCMTILEYFTLETRKSMRKLTLNTLCLNMFRLQYKMCAYADNYDLCTEDDYTTFGFFDSAYKVREYKYL